MAQAYVVGHIRVLDEQAWASYRAGVPATLAPWGGELLLRGTHAATWAGEAPLPGIVVIRFPDAAAAQGWFRSEAYQALLPVRQRAAQVALHCYEA